MDAFDAILNPETEWEAVSVVARACVRAGPRALARGGVRAGQDAPSRTRCVRQCACTDVLLHVALHRRGARTAKRLGAHRVLPAPILRGAVPRGSAVFVLSASHPG